MALVGGGGAGNVAGGNPSGTGGSINYIGNHAYAYSGAVAVNNETTLLLFTTQNSYIVCKFQPQYLEASFSSDDIIYRIKANNELIALVTVTATREYTPYEEVELLLAPYTTIEITAENTEDNSKNAGAIITGRVYA